MSSCKSMALYYVQKRKLRGFILAYARAEKYQQLKGKYFIPLELKNAHRYRMDKGFYPFNVQGLDPVFESEQTIVNHQAWTIPLRYLG